LFDLARLLLTSLAGEQLWFSRPSSSLTVAVMR
jgi:hypothetical protein